MNLIYPVYPDTKTIDEEYKEEYLYAKNAGFNIVLFDIENLKLYGDLSLQNCIYRGWMINKETYIWLSEHISLYISFEIHSLSNYIDSWYHKISDLTFETEFFNNLEDIKEFEQLKILKNNVKFISMVSNKKEIESALLDYKYDIFDGIILRKFAFIDFHSEERFFCFNGIPHKKAPDIVYSALSRLEPKAFYTIDTVRLSYTEEFIIIEIGDGQVSGLKEVKLNELYRLIEGNINE